MGIDFNPFRRINDSLSPEEIEAKVEERNRQTREMANQAYLTSEVPPSTAKRAAEHSSVQRRTPEGQKARRDASHWSKAQELGRLGKRISDHFGNEDEDL
jgi:hypothetical protein